MGTRDVGIKELRNHTAEVIDAVSDGEIVYLTRRGVRIAEIRPIGEDADARRRRFLQRLRAGQPVAEPIASPDEDIDTFRARQWNR